jgi:hypothetical protein
MSDDHFADFDETSTSSPYAGERRYSEEVFSKKISAKFRTFFVDVKKNENGHLIKISEKSRGGKKSTVMLDEEDLPAIISALQGADSACSLNRD